ncbi:DUF6380 family protein [Streptomyces sp. NPDC127079]
MDNPGRGGSTGGKRQATLRGGVASLTATVPRGRFRQHDGQAGKGAR